MMAAEDTRLRASTGAVGAALAILVGGWIAAGSVGFLSGPLRLTLVWLVVVMAAIAGWRRGRSTESRRWLTRPEAITLVVLAAAMVLPMLLRPGPAYWVLLIALLGALLAAINEGVDRKVLQVAGFAVFALSLYRFAVAAVAAIWLLSDSVGAALGWVTGAFTGVPLRIGATFGGVDFLVAMSGLVAAWLFVVPGRRIRRVLLAAAVMTAAQLGYLVVLSHAELVLASLPEVIPPPRPEMYIPPDWNWAKATTALIPWNLPLLAACLHGAVALAVFRWTDWSRGDEPGGTDHWQEPIWRRDLYAWGPIVLAGLAVVVATLCPMKSELTGKTIVAYERGYLNWEKPRHGVYGQMSVGTYGMLPNFIRSLGGQFRTVSDLQQDDWKTADVLLLLHPTDRWSDEQLADLTDYVSGGGSLLIVAAPSMRDEKSESTFNGVLRPWGIRVREDVAVGRTKGWQHALCALPHPTTGGVDTRRRWLGHLETSSIDMHWTARPLIVGRWGWSDPGSDAVLTEHAQLDSGERLGDLVIAASRPVGRGRVVVLGDPVCLTNLGNPSQYPLTGRLLSLLARKQRAIDPHAWWRQLLAVVFLVGIVVLCVPHLPPMRLAATTSVMMIAGSICVSFNEWQSRVVPDGALIADANTGLASAVAYVDAAHVPAYRDEQWAPDGLGGLNLMLMRNGFLPLEMYDLTAKRLERAGVLVTIGPARPFSTAECKVVKDFVRRGGLLICMIGGEEVPTSNTLLETFDLSLPKSPVRPGDSSEEPQPMGNITTRYPPDADADRGDSVWPVTFYTAWPVDSKQSGVTIRTMGTVRQPTIDPLGGDDENVAELSYPVVVSRKVGEGRVVLIGDTNFALYKNLEYGSGEPYREQDNNADYWRWLISEVTGRKGWSPPPAAETAGGQSAQEAAP
jgi:hypothetical protein